MRILAWPAFVNRRHNPYNWQLYTHLERRGAQVDEFPLWRLLRGQYAIWHLHWPECVINFRHWVPAAANAFGFLRLLDIARRRGVRIVWTVHNFEAHDCLQPRLESWFWQHFTRRVDGYICLTEGALHQAQRRFPALAQAPGFVIPHGHYRQVYLNRCDRQTARMRLSIPPQARVFVYFGQIRPYKNVVSLLTAFRELTDPGAILVIAGRCTEADLRQEIAAAAAFDERVRLWTDFIPPQNVQYFLNAADLVVLPYRTILNSGSALLALSFNRPVLAPALGALGELRTQVGADWVRTYQGAMTATELAAGLLWALQTPRPERAPLEALDWDEIARQTLDAYGQIWTGRLCLPLPVDAVQLDAP